MKGGSNFTYCGITKEWKPLYQKQTVLIGSISLSLVCLVVALICICCGLSKSRDGCALKPYTRWLPVSKMLYDVFDVALDIYTFYQLDQGGLIDSLIYRNAYVVNAIMVFAVFGALKCIGVSIAFVLITSDEGDLDDFGEHGPEKIKMFHAKKFKYLSIYLTFIFEDGIEMFLEYFWLEKYFTQSAPIYMVVKDVTLVLVAIYAICGSCCGGRHPMSNCLFRFLIGATVFIFLSEILRVVGAVYQYKKGILSSRDCLKVDHGKLIQTPFDADCLRKIDYAIVFFTFFVYFIVCLCSVFYLLCCEGKKSPDRDDYEEFDNGIKESRKRMEPLRSIRDKMRPAKKCVKCRKQLSKNQINQTVKYCSLNCQRDAERSRELFNRNTYDSRKKKGLSIRKCNMCHDWLTPVDERVGNKVCSQCQRKERSKYVKEQWESGTYLRDI